VGQAFQLARAPRPACRLRLRRERAFRGTAAGETPVVGLGLGWRDARGARPPSPGHRPGRRRAPWYLPRSQRASWWGAGDGPAQPSVSSFLAVRRVRGPGGRSGPARTSLGVVFHIRRHLPIGVLCHTIPGGFPAGWSGGRQRRPEGTGRPNRPRLWAGWRRRQVTPPPLAWSRTCVTERGRFPDTVASASWKACATNRGTVPPTPCAASPASPRGGRPPPGSRGRPGCGRRWWSRGRAR
jgi:hypothetical protein